MTEESPEAAAIERRLRTTDAKTGETKLISEAAVAALDGPIVILGDPGLGKSVLTEKLGRQGDNKYVRAGTFVRTQSPAAFIPEIGGRLVIDGLDEIASTAAGGGVDSVLRQLSAIGNPPFILSSREADWQGAAARASIEDDYGERVVVLHLDPFDLHQARQFLLTRFPQVDANAVLEHLASRGLDDIYRNPLTLRLFGEVANADSTLPRTRPELIDRACRIMLREENPRHQYAAHAVLAEEQLLLASGALCACVLLCNQAGLCSGPTALAPPGYVHVSSVQDLPLAEAAPQALSTRLFQADGENRWLHVHRVIAEFLGAKWLAACFERGTSERRIRSLIDQGKGVPTSLRGLHAWMAHFSGGLAAKCIAADPYAVLRYGNAETLPLEHARILLRELRLLSKEDPYFRSEDWGQHPAAGLVRPELKNELLAALSDGDSQLALLLIESMEGSDSVAALAGDLESVLFDPARAFAARSRATAVLLGANHSDVQRIVGRLLLFGDGDSNRLAFEVVRRVGIAAVSATVAVEALLASAGVTVSPVVRNAKRRVHPVYLPSELFTSLNPEQLKAFLDLLAEYALPTTSFEDDWLKEGFADAVRKAVLHALRTDSTVTPIQAWKWLERLSRHTGYDRETVIALSEHFRSEPALRRAIQAHVILGAPEGELRLHAFRLADSGAGLYPDADDLVSLIHAFGAQSTGPPDLARLREVVSLGWTQEGLATAVRAAATALASDDESFLRDLAEWSTPRKYQYEEKQQKQTKRQRQKRLATYDRVRKLHAKASVQILDGDNVGLLYQAAGVYLGRYQEFDSEAPPASRLTAMLGPQLAEEALLGFIATVRRGGAPSAVEIAETHAKGRRWNIEPVLVCGIAEMLRRGESLSSLPIGTLESAYMAWRRQPESNIVGGVQIGTALDSIVLDGDDRAERFFRSSIEPQLLAGRSYVEDLYPLTHDGRWATLSGRLASEWLSKHTKLSPEAETELLDAAARRGQAPDVRDIAVASRERVHASYDSMLGWLSLDFAFDFDRSRAHATEAASEDRDFLWHIRRRTPGHLSIAQRAFIVEAFGTSWPRCSPPEGGWSGDTNPWDASEFVGKIISSIAGEPVTEATEALQRLLNIAAPTYASALQHALATQTKVRRDHEFVATPLKQIAAVTSNAFPATIDDMRAYFGDRIATLQSRMHATNTDMWEAYWNDQTPRPENFCRNRLIEHISGQLPEGVRFEPEMHMPNQKRADIAAIFGAIGLPVEIKGQWHSQVWQAPVEQLAAKYSRDWHAHDRGAYIVLWFGDVPKKQLPPHPRGLARPTSPEQLHEMLIELIPRQLQDLIDFYVVDVSRAASNA